MHDTAANNAQYPATSLRQRKVVCSGCGSRSQLDDMEELGSDLKLEQGIRIALCRCQQSQSFPLCDKTHEVFNRETNSSIKPLYIHVSRAKSSEEPSKVENTKFDAQNSAEKAATSETLETTLNKEKTQTKEAESSEQVETLEKPSLTREQALQNIKRVNKSKLKGAIYTREEVALHCTKEDCWMIIDGKVYDLTSYFPFHPGGVRALLKFAGKDGTENVQFHSPKMMKLLEEYFFIGYLEKENGGRCCVM